MSDERIVRARQVSIAGFLSGRGVNLWRQGKWMVGPCLICGGGEDRFFVNDKNIWGCRQCDTGGDIIDLVMKVNDADLSGALDYLAGPAPARASRPKPDFRNPVAVFNYRNEHGAIVYRNVRYALVNADGTPVLSKKGKPDKTFVQEHYDEARRTWVKGRTGPAIPYRLLEMVETLATEPTVEVYIVEGERKADLLRSWGLTATSIMGGKDDAIESQAGWFKGAHAIVIPDHDAAGKKHAETVARVLAKVAASVHWLALPGLADGEDIEDWKAKGGTYEELMALVAAASLFRSASETLPPADDQEREGFSEDALALRLIVERGDDLRYVAKWAKWLQWDGARWKVEETLAVMDTSRRMLRAVAHEAANERMRKTLRSSSTVAAVERLARVDRAVALVVDDLDRDPWLFNTPSGTIDLATGQLHRHDRHNHITKMATAEFGGECPMWLDFLHRITGNDEELIGFIQRMLGYGLTGSTQEQCLFFLYGTGANGKSVLLSTIAHIMGDYHTTAPIETFTEVDGNRHPTELAGLHGARLVTSIETEEGRRWAESKIKQLTGGDRISARFMRQDFFQFTPQFKLIIAGNHRPALRTVDEAIRRRFRLVPFAVTIPEHERDQRLDEKLRAESAGILKWIVDGCMVWRTGGLQPPAAVMAATKEYLEGEDALSSWITDCCVIDVNASTTSTDLFNSWSSWAQRSGEFVGSLKRFVQKLENRPGLQPYRDMHGRGFDGIRINPDR